MLADDLFAVIGADIRIPHWVVRQREASYARCAPDFALLTIELKPFHSFFSLMLFHLFCIVHSQQDASIAASENAAAIYRIGRIFIDIIHPLGSKQHCYTSTSCVREPAQAQWSFPP